MAQTPTEPHSTAWCAGSTVFAACATDGAEFCLWLQPDPQHFDLFEERVDVRPGVRFAMAKEAEPRPVPLVAVWWRLDRACSPQHCTCGPVALIDVLDALPPAASGQALAAHIDLVTALEDRLQVVPPGAPHALEVVDALTRLAADLATCRPVLR